jgi:hypothetical protein
VQAEQLFSRPAEPLGFTAPLIQENASIIHELVPSLEPHFWGAFASDLPAGTGIVISSWYPGQQVANSSAHA